MSHLFQKPGNDGGEGEREGGGFGGGSPGGYEEGDAARGFSRTEAAPITFGPAKKSRLRGKYPFDAVRAGSKDVPGSTASGNAVMDSTAFHDACEKLLKVGGFHDQMPEVKLGYLQAVFLSYVLTSSSQLAPDRAGFQIDGCDRVFNFHQDVLYVLGDDARRFFRAAATDIYVMLKEMFDKSGRGSLTDGQEEALQVLRLQASFRGLGRIPWCCFDTAEWVLVDTMGQSERLQVLTVKSQVLPASNSLADVGRQIAATGAVVRESSGVGKQNPASERGWNV